MSLFALAVLGLCLANLLLSFLVATHGSDEVAYHLSRIYFWAQTETARHFVTFDPRQTEFPPNNSFSMLWIMLLSGGTAGLHLPQWLAGIVTAIGTAGLVRLAGHGKRAAVFTGLILLTTTGAILQMATRHNDLLTAAMTVSFLYFAFRAMHKGPRRGPMLAYAGIAFGLALGTKFTFFLLLPGVSLALLVYGWRRQGRAALRLLIALGLSCLIGFTLFGAYNYVLNYAAFGQPLSSRPLSDSSAVNEGKPRREALYGLGTNLIRYLYQMVDWAGIADDDQQPLYYQYHGLFDQISRWAGLDPESVPEFTYNHVGLRPLDIYTSGYGLIFYVVLIASPLLLLIFAWKARRSRRYDLPLALLFMAWAWILLTAGILPWDPYRLRFFMIVVPLLLAAVLPWMLLSRRIALLWLLPLMLLALWTGFHATFDTFGRSEWIQGVDIEDENLDQIGPQERDFLHVVVPPGSRLGITGQELRLWDFVTALPEYHFKLVPGDQVDDYFASGEADLLLSPMRSCVEDGEARYLYFPINPLFACLLIESPLDFLAQPSAVEFYGYTLMQTAHQSYLALDPTRAMIGEDEFRIDISFPLDFFATDQLQIDLPYRNGRLSENDLIEMTCNGSDVSYNLRENGLSLYLSQEAVVPRQVFQRCQILHQYNPALRADSVLIYPKDPPAPDTEPDAQFNNGPTLLAADLPETANTCGTLYLSFWWAGSAPSIDQVVYLADAGGIPLVEERTALEINGGLSRRFINLPCDLAPGSYDLLMRLYLGNTALNQSNSSDLVYLGKVTVTSPGN